ncbi:MAG TPA: ABC transporter ATP-binding protein, partial [Sphingobacteriaceae bacterium]|nr:ABC transporter ATP-binding protein [Sphingobacteriaceae bacterium]
LDEPTNHLDIQSVNILIQALQQFEGTFILVSHDRYLLDKVANKIWFIEDQQIKEYPGTYAEYEEWQAKRPAITVKPVAAEVKKDRPAEPSVKEVRPVTDEKNKQLKKLNQTLEKLEEDINSLEQSVKAAEDELAQEEIYSDQVKLIASDQRYKQLNGQLQAKKDEWEELAGQILELDSQ